MKTAFINAKIFDGTSDCTYPGEVLLEGNRIARVVAGHGHISGSADNEIDCSGKTLMPGLIEGHAHLSFNGASTLASLGEVPPEEHTLQTAYNAKLLLDMGFTSAYSAASSKLRLEVAVKNEINAGRLSGPRVRSATPEITVTGGLGDERLFHLHRESFSVIVDGPHEMRKFVRLAAREGCDNIKLNISGDSFNPAASSELTIMTEEEVRTAVETAHSFGRRVSAHTRASDAVKLAVRAGVDVLYHCEFVDDEAIEMLVEAKDRIFIGPAIGLIWNTIHEAREFGFDEAAVEALGYPEIMERAQKSYRILHERGVRIVPGGDYGFAWTPMGTNARDIEHFVNLFGYTPAQALQAATRVGGELMGMEVGQISEGYLADLLLIDGDPVEDVRLVQDRSKIAMVMKDGVVHRTEIPSLTHLVP